MRTPYNSLLARLWLLDGAAAVKVSLDHGEVVMRQVRKTVGAGAKINEYWENRIADALHHDGAVYITYSDGDYYLTPVEPSDPQREGVLVYKLRIGRETVGCYQFGELLTSDRPGLALALFGEINTYTLGRAILWDLDHQNETISLRKGSCSQLKVSDFLAIGPHYKFKGQSCGMAFYHRKLGFLNGLKELKEEFPSATTKEIRQIYKAFGYTPSSHIGSIFKEAPEAPEAPPEKKSSDLDYFIQEYELRPSRDSGLVISSKAQMADVVVNKPSELVQCLRMEGEVIEASKGRRLWKKVMGKKETE